jgi:hypothetical protein
MMSMFQCMTVVFPSRARLVESHGHAFLCKKTPRVVFCVLQDFGISHDDIASYVGNFWNNRFNNCSKTNSYPADNYYKLMLASATYTDCNCQTIVSSTPVSCLPPASQPTASRSSFLETGEKTATRDNDVHRVEVNADSSIAMMQSSSHATKHSSRSDTRLRDSHGSESNVGVSNSEFEDSDDIADENEKSASKDAHTGGRAEVGVNSKGDSTVQKNTKTKFLETRAKDAA